MTRQEERKHCERVVDAFHGNTVDLLMRERDAARREGRMSMRRIGIPENDWMGRAVEAEEELAACKAKLANLHGEVGSALSCGGDYERLARAYEASR